MKLANRTFKGGVHFDDHKALANKKAIEAANAPQVVYIPLHQHIGAPCTPTVKVGDEVKIGTVIGSSDAFVSAFVHSSVSGVVKKIEKRFTVEGRFCDCVEIENNCLDEKEEFAPFNADFSNIDDDAFIDAIKRAGIVGMGGAAFPLHAKLSSSKKAGVKSIIANGAECEPFLTCDHRIMLERPEPLVRGMEILVKYMGADEGIIGVEDNKMDAIEAVDKACSSVEKIDVMKLKTKFPQGDSTRMIDTILNKKVPVGARSSAVSAMVSNVGTISALANAIDKGVPLYERVITVTGEGISEPKNIMARIGTPIRDLIAQCGGFKKNPKVIISGGPMTGTAQFSLDAPVTKSTTGVIVFGEEDVHFYEDYPCIRCGKCVDKCPVFLKPASIYTASMKGKFDLCEQLSADECMECGTCSFVCPSHKPLTESIKHAKREIKLNQKKR